MSSRHSSPSESSADSAISYSNSDLDGPGDWELVGPWTSRAKENQTSAPSSASTAATNVAPKPGSCRRSAAPGPRLRHVRQGCKTNTNFVPRTAGLQMTQLHPAIAAPLEELLPVDDETVANPASAGFLPVDNETLAPPASAASSAGSQPVLDSGTQTVEELIRIHLAPALPQNKIVRSCSVVHDERDS